MTAITDPIGGNQAYTYDNVDRVWGAPGPVFNFSCGNNELRNLTYWPVVGQYAYPGNGGGPGTHPHGVCATNPGGGNCTSGTVYTYDGNGNMTGGAGRTLQYDPFNRLVHVITSAGTTNFVYDADGNRIQKSYPLTGGGTSTVTYFGKWTECEQGACTKYIWAGGQRLAMKTVTSGVVTYYHTDRQGTTMFVTNGSGQQQETLAYYPFGQQWLDQGLANVPYKYTGQEYDSSTGLYFYQARYYDPLLGRFTQPDTIVSDIYIPMAWNRYTYVMNNPFRYTDPTGHEGEEAANTATLAAAGGAAWTTALGSLRNAATSAWTRIPSFTGVGQVITATTETLATVGAEVSMVGTAVATVGLAAVTVLATPSDIAEEPPIPGFGVGSPVIPSIYFSEEDAQKQGPAPNIPELVKPGGQWIGDAGSRNYIRRLPGGEQGAQDWLDRLTIGASERPNPTNGGRQFDLPGGGQVGYRPDTTKIPNIDINNVPGLQDVKLKFP